MKKLITTLVLSLCTAILFGQGYQFSDVVRIDVTPVKNQSATGTCWAFATTSFLEAELLRQGKGTHDLSEMFVVRQKYLNQLEDNYYRRGKGNVSQGSLSHTFINAYKQVGIVPESVYSGINYDSPTHNHSELGRYVEAIAGTAVEMKKRSPQYYEIVNHLFDTYLGEVPETFTYEGKSYTPQSFAASLGLNMDDYIEIGSYTHKPYYQPFILEVPDNWEYEPIWNVPLDELIEIMNYALKNGFTVAWDGDVSERGFSHVNGVAINPDVKDLSRLPQTDRDRFEKLNAQAQLDEVYKFDRPYPEVVVTPEIRQEGYESFVTTDDHLMHVTGIVKDQNGTPYYITKNSWGTERNRFGGYLNMSESFVRAKTIFILVHKDAVPAAIRRKLGI